MLWHQDWYQARIFWYNLLPIRSIVSFSRAQFTDIIVSKFTEHVPLEIVSNLKWSVVQIGFHRFWFNALLPDTSVYVASKPVSVCGIFWNNCHVQLLFRGSCTAFLLVLLHFCTQQYIGYALVYHISWVVGMLHSSPYTCWHVFTEDSSLCTALMWWFKHVYIFLQNMYGCAGRSDFFPSVVHFGFYSYDFITSLNWQCFGSSISNSLILSSSVMWTHIFTTDSDLYYGKHLCCMSVCWIAIKNLLTHSLTVFAILHCMPKLTVIQELMLQTAFAARRARLTWASITAYLRVWTLQNTSDFSYTNINTNVFRCSLRRLILLMYMVIVELMLIDDDSK